ncbi:crotonase/enoyl-CoA hydratase family protein [Pandoraea pulmonicola]|uniref:Enoyl-CoA hydratase n=1 Tax=Pandoraea pulmonicola TaxID=93221 RepID=A0AAJ4ZHC0_PANPU|nr:crotonase/enoyl-CoA hydratase family protein [Pandoraea pulmonicola]AJC22510.2 enoyl-CoA hydratase [Pandoraea pulmonicola]SUA93324.1 Probable enoyl-CoA hydratase echA8 [Pandoraea pulmonicola]
MSPSSGDPDPAATPYVEVETDGAVAIITLARPGRRNAVDRDMAAALRDALLAFEQDDNVSVAVLCGKGAGFCAGADLSAFDDPQRRNVVTPDGSGDGPMGLTRRHLDKPVIAAVSGHAVAGGLELALWCDLRVADDSATFGVFCRRFGVPLIDGGTVRLPRLIGMSRALDLILTGRAVGAQEAFEIGLVNRLVPEGMARQGAVALARQLAALPQGALRADRRAAYAQWDLSLEEALRREGAAGHAVVFSEGIAGARAFLSGAGRHGAPRDAS